MTQQQITRETAIQNLRPGDEVQIPSGMGGIFTAVFQQFVPDGSGALEVSVNHSDADFDGAVRSAWPDEVTFPALTTGFSSRERISAVRDDNGRQHLVRPLDNGFDVAVSLPEQSQYKDHKQFLVGYAKAVSALEYFNDNARYIHKRQPTANATELQRLVKTVSEGHWVSPLDFEDAAAEAGVRIDLTDWCDAELEAPIRQCSARHAKDVIAFVDAMTANGVQIEQGITPSDLEGKPISAEGGVQQAIEVASAYLESVNLADSIEIRTTDKADIAMVSAAGLDLQVSPTSWEWSIRRPFSKANDAWLQTVQSSFEHVDVVHTIDLDSPSSAPAERPTL